MSDSNSAERELTNCANLMDACRPDIDRVRLLLPQLRDIDHDDYPIESMEIREMVNRYLLTDEIPDLRRLCDLVAAVWEMG